jgi:tetrahydromethanopterin S-methyltransferase subunit G
MQENMFYGESLDFEELMKRIKELNKKLKTVDYGNP